MFCTSCGKPMSPGAGFCTRCGKATGKGPGPMAVPPQPAPATPTPTVPGIRPEPGPGKSGASAKAKWLVAATALAGVVVLAAFLLFGLLGSSGAESPQAAVTGLADAISRQDLMSAVSMLPPDEMSGLPSTLKALLGKLDGAGMLSSAAPLDGITVRIDDAQTEVEQLSDDVAMVHLRGRVSVHSDTGEVPAPLRGALGLADNSVRDVSYDLANDVPRYLDDRSHRGLALMTVKRGGGWYVSPMYTTAELIRQGYNDSHSAGIPRPSFREGDEAPKGADSAEGAVRRLLEADYADDIDGMVDALAPDETRVLRDYRDALHRISLGTSGSSHITDLDTHTEDGPGGVTYVVVDKFAAEGSGVEGSAQMTVAGNCVNIDVVDRSSYGSGDSSSKGGCLTDALAREDTPSAAAAQELLRDERVRFATVERDGSWYVSPMRTATGYVDRWLGMIDKSAVYRLLDVPQMADPTGEIAVGGGADVSVDEARPAVLSARIGTAGAYAATTGAGSSSVSIFRDDGSGVTGATAGGDWPVHLEPGSYRLVVRGSGPARVSLNEVPSVAVAAPGTVAVTTTDARSALVTGITSQTQGWFTVTVDGAVTKVQVRDSSREYASTHFTSAGGIHLEPGHTYEAMLQSETPGALQVTIAGAAPGLLFADADTQTGYLSTGGRSVYQVYLGKGERVELKAEAETGSSGSSSYSYGYVDPMLAVSAPDGTVLARVDDSSGSKNAAADIVAPSTGIYTVHVGAYGSTSGRFRLTFNRK